jgi:hypothetical protein
MTRMHHDYYGGAQAAIHRTEWMYLIFPGFRDRKIRCIIKIKRITVQTFIRYDSRYDLRPGAFFASHVFPTQAEPYGLAAIFVAELEAKRAVGVE